MLEFCLDAFSVLKLEIYSYLIDIFLAVLFRACYCSL